MTVTEIKLETLRLLLGGRWEPNGREIADMEGDGECGDYLARMTGALNRALADLERRYALTPIRMQVPSEAWRHTAHTSRLSLGALGGIYAVLSVARENENGYESGVAFSREGEELLLPRLGEGETVYLTYAPRARYLARWENGEELSYVPEGVQTLLPLFLKGELLREEEPAEANEARNLYEAGVEDYLARTGVGGALGDGRVATVYSQVLL